MAEINPIAAYEPLPWQVQPLLCTDPIMLLTGSAGGGKALALDTEIPTVNGWCTMADLNVGDFLFGRDGRPTCIVAATDVLQDRPCYAVTFSTGETIVADAQHFWIVQNLSNQTEQVVETKKLFSVYKKGIHDRKNYGVLLCDPIDPVIVDLPIPPYTLGVLLGDGYIAQSAISFVSGDQGIVDNIQADLGSNYQLSTLDVRKNCVTYGIKPVMRSARVWSHSKGWYVRTHQQSGGFMAFVREPHKGYHYVGYGQSKETLTDLCESYPGERYSADELAGSELFTSLKELGLAGTKSATKFIPECYKFASYADRLALLQGLMDTDGSIDKERGRVEYCSISQQLAKDVFELCCSLGIKAYIAERYVKLDGKKYVAWRVQFTASTQVFRLKRKADLVKSVFRKTQLVRYITEIVEVESVPVRCVQVDNADGSYLVTRSFITTHNSKVAAEKVHLFLQKYPNSMGLVVRKQRNSMTNSTVLFLEVSVIGDDPKVRHFPSKNRFEYTNGSILAYGGMDGEEQKQQIRSIGQEGSLHIVWMEEANSFNEDDFNEILARMRGRGTPWRQIILSTNPDSPTHWVYTRLISGQEATVFYSHAEQNKHNADDYVTTLKKLTGVARLRLTEGRWVQASGAIYDTFSLDVHRIKPFAIPKDWSRILAIDFGYVHPFVCLFGAVDHDGRIYIYKEIHYTKRTVSTHLKTILAEIDKDGADIDVVVCDHDAEDRMTLSDGGLPNIPADKEVERGIQVVMDRLKVQGDGKPRLMIFDNALIETDPELVEKKKPLCLLDEFPGYVWAVTQGTQNPKEAPLKLNDDSLDALRYLCMFADSAELMGMDWARG